MSSLRSRVCSFASKLSILTASAALVSYSASIAAPQAASQTLATVSAATVVGSGASLIFDGNSTEAVIRFGSGQSLLNIINAFAPSSYRSGITLSATYRCGPAPVIDNFNQAQHDAFGMDPQAQGTLVSVSQDSGNQIAYDGLHYDFFHNTTNLFFTYSVNNYALGVRCESSSFPSTAGGYVTSSVTLDRTSGNCTFYLNGMELPNTQYQGNKPTTTAALPQIRYPVVAIGSRLGKGFVANNTIIALVTAWDERSAADLIADTQTKPNMGQAGLIYLFDFSGPVSSSSNQFSLETQFGSEAAAASNLSVWTQDADQAGFGAISAEVKGKTCYALIYTSPAACNVSACGSFNYNSSSPQYTQYQGLNSCGLPPAPLVSVSSSSSTGGATTGNTTRGSSSSTGAGAASASGSSTGATSSSVSLLSSRSGVVATFTVIASCVMFAFGQVSGWYCTCA